MNSERRRGTRRQKRPPGPPVPPECPVCGECPPETETHATRRDPCGWVEGEINCADCGHTLKRNVLLRDPDRV